MSCDRLLSRLVNVDDVARWSAVLPYRARRYMAPPALPAAQSRLRRRTPVPLAERRLLERGVMAAVLALDMEDESARHERSF
jgi:hypothetical protein